MSYSSSSSMPAIARQRLICAPSSVAAPAFGSPVAPACAGAAAPAPKSHLRRLVARLRLLTRDLRLRGRAIVLAVHEKARLSPRAGKRKIARTHQMGTGYRRVTRCESKFCKSLKGRLSQSDGIEVCYGIALFDLSTRMAMNASSRHNSASLPTLAAIMISMVKCPLSPATMSTRNCDRPVATTQTDSQEGFPKAPITG